MRSILSARTASRLQALQIACLGARGFGHWPAEWSQPDLAQLQGAEEMLVQCLRWRWWLHKAWRWLVTGWKQFACLHFLPDGRGFMRSRANWQTEQRAFFLKVTNPSQGLPAWSGQSSWHWQCLAMMGSSSCHELTLRARQIASARTNCERPHKAPAQIKLKITCPKKEIRVHFPPF